MRVQIDVAAQDVVGTEVIEADQSAKVFERAVALLQEAGFELTQTSDHIDVPPNSADWPFLTAEEQLVGAFEFPRLHVDGETDMSFSVFRRSVRFSSAPYDDTAQEAASEVIRALRALAPILPISGERWQQLEADAAKVAVASDGSIVRPILSYGDLYFSAIGLFDEQISPEFLRPHTWAARIMALGDLAVGLPPFRGIIAISPDGSSSSVAFPRGGEFREEQMRPLREAAGLVLEGVLAASDERTGMPTGLVMAHDDTGTFTVVVFDNPVDGGAFTPGGRPAGHRRAPHAWQEIVHAAARRDPQYQPTWLPDAVALMWEGGISVPVVTASPSDDVSAVEEAPQAPTSGWLRRLGQWLSAGRNED